MDIHSLTEEDIKLRFITPAILSKDWSFEDISMEMLVKLTDGRYRHCHHSKGARTKKLVSRPESGLKFPSCEWSLLAGFKPW